MAKCNTCGWPSKDGLCRPKAFRVPRMMSDAEASKVILPKLGTVYTTEYGGHTPFVRSAKRDEHGQPIVDSRGDGKMKNPRAEYINGDPVERYRQAMGGSLVAGKGNPIDPRAVDWGYYREWEAAGPDPWARILARVNRPELVEAVAAMRAEFGQASIAA